MAFYEDHIKPIGDFAGSTVFSGDWWKKTGKGLIVAVPAAMGFFKLIEWFYDSMLGRDGGGLLGFIPDFFGKLSAFGFTARVFPQILNWSNETALPWLGEKFGAMGSWAKGAAQKTFGGGVKKDEHSELSPELLGEPKRQDMAMMMPKTDVSLGAVVYEGSVERGESGQLAPAVRQVASAAAKAASEAPAISA